MEIGKAKLLWHEEGYLEFANNCSAISITRKGAIPSYPTLGEALKG